MLNGTIRPITQYPDGPVSGVIGAIATREKVKPEQVLLAWSKAKGATVVTYVNSAHTYDRIAHQDYRTSRSEDRLKGYLGAGDLGTFTFVKLILPSLTSTSSALTTSDLAKIDAAGVKGTDPVKPVTYIDEKAVLRVEDADLAVAPPSNADLESGVVRSPGRLSQAIWSAIIIGYIITSIVNMVFLIVGFVNRELVPSGLRGCVSSANLLLFVLFVARECRKKKAKY